MSIRLARSSRLAERTKPSDDALRYGSALGRMGQHLGREAGRPLEPAGDVRRRREQTRRLGERGAVELLHLTAQRAVLRRRTELPELRAVELVRLAELVHEPYPLLAVANDVRRELRRDDDVDPAPVGLLEVEQPPEERLGQHARAGIPLERHRDEVGVVPARPQLLDELVGEDLDASARERHLGAQDRDAHMRPYRFSAGRRSASSASRLATRCSRSSTSRRAAALNERWS